MSVQNTPQLIAVIVAFIIKEKKKVDLLLLRIRNNAIYSDISAFKANE